MVPYIITALIPILIYYPFNKDFQGLKKETNKKTYIFICGFLIFLFLAVRSRFVGSTDTQHYYDVMSKAIKAKKWDNFYDPNLYEAGFQFFVFLLSRVFKDPQWIIVISTAIYVGAICYFIYKNSDDATLSIVMYICLGLMTFQMQGMRQAIAMALCLFAYECAKNKKIIPFILWCALATSIHRTAIVFLVVYPVVQLKYNYINLTILFIGSILVLLLSNSIVALGNFIFDEHYTNLAEAGGYIATLIYILILLFYMLFAERIIMDKQSVGIFYVVFIGFICYVLRYTGAQAAERISYYFMFGQSMLLPKILNVFSGKDRKIVKIVVYILIIALFAYRLNGSVVVPYEFFWKVY